MIDLDFSSAWIQAIAEHRTPLATALFQLFTFLGEIEGYVLIVAAIYAAFDKRLAFRLAIVVLATMSINHVMKTILANPRPFVAEGSFSQHWAVSQAKAAELAAEYSTPSGHAMAGGSFYGFLYASVKSRWVKFVAVVALLLTGISRPYLGVHYVEDILLGWPLGIAFAAICLRLSETVGDLWLRLSAAMQGLIVVLSSAILVAGTSLLYDDAPHGQPLPFISYLGLLSGVVVAYPLEIRWVDFDPRNSTRLLALTRVALCAALVMGTLLVLDLVFAKMSPDGSVLGNVLRYLRYVVAAFAGMLAAPYLFIRFGLADTVQRGADSVDSVASEREASGTE